MNNDRFRFRIWNKVLHRYQKSIILTRDDEVCAPGSGDDRFVIEQCTGISDRNGKLIYEGDRVKTVIEAVGTVQWNERMARFEVRFRTFRCEVCNTQEIVGNIHERMHE